MDRTYDRRYGDDRRHGRDDRHSDRGYARQYDDLVYDERPRSERYDRDDRFDRNRRFDEDRRFERRGREDRGFFERAADAVTSWFGDDDQDRRRIHEEFNGPEAYRYGPPSGSPGPPGDDRRRYDEPARGGYGFRGRTGTYGGRERERFSDEPRRYEPLRDEPHRYDRDRDDRGYRAYGSGRPGPSGRHTESRGDYGGGFRSGYGRGSGYDQGPGSGYDRRGSSDDDRWRGEDYGRSERRNARGTDDRNYDSPYGGY